MVSKMNTITELGALLRNTPSGPVPAETQVNVLKLLTECWAEFAGSTDSKMECWKVGREGTRDMAWNPPFLTFIIVRHGATVLGSTRGDKQQWRLNLEEKTAHHSTVGYVQLYPTAARLNVKSIAAQVYEVVGLGPGSDSKLISKGIVAWKDDHVIVAYGKLIPDDGYQMTVSGRRKRFRAELTSLMAEIGWELVDVRRGMMTFKRRESVLLMESDDTAATVMSIKT
jgi:hypothetical protein